MRGFRPLKRPYVSVFVSVCKQASNRPKSVSTCCLPFDKSANSHFQKFALLTKIPKIHAAQILCTLYIVTLYIVLFSLFSNPAGIFL